jgi:hypothetical protein
MNIIASPPPPRVCYFYNCYGIIYIVIHMYVLYLMLGGILSHRMYHKYSVPVQLHADNTISSVHIHIYQL